MVHKPNWNLCMICSFLFFDKIWCLNMYWHTFAIYLTKYLNEKMHRTNVVIHFKHIKLFADSSVAKYDKKNTKCWVNWNGMHSHKTAKYTVESCAIAFFVSYIGYCVWCFFYSTAILGITKTKWEHKIIWIVNSWYKSIKIQSSSSIHFWL